MKIDTEKDQRFLRLMYYIQKNNSNAVLTIYRVSRELMPHDVKLVSSGWVAEISEPKKNNTERKKGGRPPKLTENDIPQIYLWLSQGIKKREIARRKSVDLHTICDFLKKHFEADLSWHEPQ